MIPNLPPGPYSYEILSLVKAPDSGHVYILDAKGRKIAGMWGKHAEKLALAELICAASDREFPQK